MCSLFFINVIFPAFIAFIIWHYSVVESILRIAGYLLLRTQKQDVYPFRCLICQHLSKTQEESKWLIEARKVDALTTFSQDVTHYSMGGGIFNVKRELSKILSINCWCCCYIICFGNGNWLAVCVCVYDQGLHGTEMKERKREWRNKEKKENWERERKRDKQASTMKEKDESGSERERGG